MGQQGQDCHCSGIRVSARSGPDKSGSGTVKSDSDFRGGWAQVSGGTWQLTADEVKKVLALRDDFRPEDIQHIDLGGS